MEEINNKDLKLSIITINLNNAIGLKNTVQSIINQSFAYYELIIVDGGSLDSSVEIINSFSKGIRYWISEPDNGIYHAMNKGIAQATGEYCFFLNSGDYLADNRVLEKVFEKNPTEDILFGNLFVTINGKIIGKAFGMKNLTFSDVYAHTIKHQAAFIKHSLFEQFGMFNENRRIIADWEFFIKTVGLGRVSYKFIDLFVAYFDNNGLSNRDPELIKNERRLVIKENIPLLMQPDFEFLLRYKPYERIYDNKISFFIIRILNKILI